MLLTQNIQYAGGGGTSPWQYEMYMERTIKKVATITNDTRFALLMQCFDSERNLKICTTETSNLLNPEYNVWNLWVCELLKPLED